MDIKRSKSSADKEINNILFVFAMEAEAEPLRTRLDLKEIENSLLNSPCKLYSGTYNGATITIAMNGKCPTFGVDNVGTTPAALTTFLAINQIHPDIVINAGTAGGFKRKTAAIGDCFLSTHVKYHDRRIPIPGFTEYGIGSYTSVACPNMVQSLNLKTGVVSTSNSLDHCDADDKLLLENDASVKEMEAASIAWTAQLSGTPYLGIKVITDIVDGDRPSHEEFMENLSAAGASLQSIVPKVLDFIIGKKFDQL